MSTLTTSASPAFAAPPVALLSATTCVSHAAAHAHDEQSCVIRREGGCSDALSRNSRIRMIQQQLHLVLHAIRCQKKRKQKDHVCVCSQSLCVHMRRLLLHVEQCGRAGKSAAVQDGGARAAGGAAAGGDCKVPHCKLTRELLSHWNSCATKHRCPICRVAILSTSPTPAVFGSYIASSKNGGAHHQHSYKSSSSASSASSYSSTSSLSPQQQGSFGGGGSSSSSNSSASFAPFDLAVGSGAHDGPPFSCSSSSNHIVSSSVSCTSLSHFTSSAKVSKLVVSSAASTNHHLTALPPSWQDEIMPYRDALLEYIVNYLLPSPILKDPRLKRVFVYLKNFEAEIWCGSSSAEEYTQRFAKKFFKIGQDFHFRQNDRLLSSHASSHNQHMQTYHSSILDDSKFKENLFLSAPQSSSSSLSLNTASANDFSSSNQQFLEIIKKELNRLKSNGTSPHPNPGKLFSLSLSSALSSDLERHLNRAVEQSAPLSPSASLVSNQNGNAPHNFSGSSSSSLQSVSPQKELSPNHHSAQSQHSYIIHPKSDSKLPSNQNFQPIGLLDPLLQSHSHAHTNTQSHTQQQHSQPQPPFGQSYKQLHKNEWYQRMHLLHSEVYSEKDAHIFHQPVNWRQLNLLDYPEIVKCPMDLSTIKSKLDDYLYDTPWNVLDDFWLMFNNAKLYNKKTSRPYKICAKIVESFQIKADKHMRQLGFCCGREMVYLPLPLNCTTPNVCTIPKDSNYYCFLNIDETGGDAVEKINPEFMFDKYFCCEKCYNETPNSEFVVFLEEITSPPIKIRKDAMTLMKNNEKQYEKFVSCVECNRKWHQICACHVDEIFESGFYCPTCIYHPSIKSELIISPHYITANQPIAVVPRRINQFTARDLPTCHLSRHLEERVNDFLDEQRRITGENIGSVLIRVLSISEKIVEVKHGMKTRYSENGEMADYFPYKLKAIFGFQEDASDTISPLHSDNPSLIYQGQGREVCFFGLHVQEYGSDCPEPNKRRVYIAYLDSVRYFTPNYIRTNVYHEILIGYLDYVKQLGFTMGHIWACPPGDGDDYIFHMHPPNQKIPKLKRLQDWYAKMLSTAQQNGIVVETRDILTDALHNKLISPTDMPYFEGDYWPNTLEELIKDVESHNSQRTHSGGVATNSNTPATGASLHSPQLSASISSIITPHTATPSLVSGSNIISASAPTNTETKDEQHFEEYLNDENTNNSSNMEELEILDDLNTTNSIDQQLILKSSKPANGSAHELESGATFLCETDKSGVDIVLNGLSIDNSTITAKKKPKKRKLKRALSKSSSHNASISSNSTGNTITSFAISYASSTSSPVASLITHTNIQNVPSLMLCNSLSNSNCNTLAKRKKPNLSLSYGTPFDMTDQLCRKIYEIMDKHKDNFFTVRLHSLSSAASLEHRDDGAGEIVDPDELINSELMEDRDTFLYFSKQRHLEFSSLRRAKFSTMVLCYELHMERIRRAASDNLSAASAASDVDTPTEQHLKLLDAAKMEPISLSDQQTQQQREANMQQTDNDNIQNVYQSNATSKLTSSDCSSAVNMRHDDEKECVNYKKCKENAATNQELVADAPIGSSEESANLLTGNLKAEAVDVVPQTLVKSTAEPGLEHELVAKSVSKTPTFSNSSNNLTPITSTNQILLCSDQSKLPTQLNALPPLQIASQSQHQQHINQLVPGSGNLLIPHSHHTLPSLSTLSTITAAVIPSSMIGCGLLSSSAILPAANQNTMLNSSAGANNAGNAATVSANKTESRRVVLERLCETLMHSSQCTAGVDSSASCFNPSYCKLMRSQLLHFQQCPLRTQSLLRVTSGQMGGAAGNNNGGSASVKCETCSTVSKLITFHARYCQLGAVCRVPFCQQFRSNRRQQDSEQRRQQMVYLRRRMAIMQHTNAQSNTSAQHTPQHTPQYTPQHSLPPTYTNHSTAAANCTPQSVQDAAHNNAGYGGKEAINNNTAPLVLIGSSPVTSALHGNASTSMQSLGAISGGSAPPPLTQVQTILCSSASVMASGNSIPVGQAAMSIISPSQLATGPSYYPQQQTGAPPYAAQMHAQTLVSPQQQQIIASQSAHAQHQSYAILANQQPHSILIGPSAVAAIPQSAATVANQKSVLQQIPGGISCSTYRTPFLSSAAADVPPPLPNMFTSAAAAVDPSCQIPAPQSGIAIISSHPAHPTHLLNQYTNTSNLLNTVPLPSAAPSLVTATTNAGVAVPNAAITQAHLRFVAQIWDQIRNSSPTPAIFQTKMSDWLQNNKQHAQAFHVFRMQQQQRATLQQQKFVPPPSAVRLVPLHQPIISQQQQQAFNVNGGVATQDVLNAASANQNTAFFKRPASSLQNSAIFTNSAAPPAATAAGEPPPS